MKKLFFMSIFAALLLTMPNLNSEITNVTFKVTNDNYFSICNNHKFFDHALNFIHVINKSTMRNITIYTTETNGNTTVFIQSHAEDFQLYQFTRMLRKLCQIAEYNMSVYKHLIKHLTSKQSLTLEKSFAIIDSIKIRPQNEQCCVQ